MVSYKLFLLVMLYSEVNGLKERTSDESKDAQEKFPYVVVLELQYLLAATYCGGSLIAPDWVISSADCAAGTIEAHTAYAGSYVNSKFEQERTVSRIVVHPKHTKFDLGAYDIALIQTEEPFTMSSGNIGILKLSGVQPNISMSLKCTIIMRGDPKPTRNVMGDHTVKYKDVIAINTHCSCLAKPPFRSYKPENALCLEEKNIACVDDAGSPLVCGGTAVGVLQHIVMEEKKCEIAAMVSECSKTVTLYIMQIYPGLDFIREVVKTLELSTDPLPYLEDEKKDDSKTDKNEDEKDDSKTDKNEDEKVTNNVKSSGNVKSKLSLLIVIVGYLCIIN